MPQIKLGILFILLCLSRLTWAYPEFIGYKYTSCLSCHYNGHGSGALTDYGRGVWASEIAGRLSSSSDEELSESSGFFGSAELPWWIRPGIKARQLAMQVNPPTPQTRYILMQAEANLAIHFDRDQQFIAVGSFGYVPVPQRLANQPAGDDVDTWISREHYIRIQARERLWLYAGMMDKVYGIRISDHTAYSRQRVGVAQNDQAHGVVVQYTGEKYEWSLNPFMGNLYQDADLRQEGVSGLLEYEVKEAWRIGATALTSSDKYVENVRYGVLSKYGFGYGSGLLFELGTIQDKPKNAQLRKGYYLYSEAIQKLARGYHLFFVGQAYKDRMEGSRPDNIRMGVGFLTFPMSRTELRFELQNNRQLTNVPAVRKESWAALAQIHLSL